MMKACDQCGGSGTILQGGGEGVDVEATECPMCEGAGEIDPAWQYYNSTPESCDGGCGTPGNCGQCPMEFTETPAGERARERWARAYDKLDGAPEGDWDR
jgi:hypothetical protein